LLGHFDARFTQLPKEILISSMQDHQRYFPIASGETLLPCFITISNIESGKAKQVIHGNERVLRARLADADFFYHSDKEPLCARNERLKNILFQAKLGSLQDKSIRMRNIVSSFPIFKKSTDQPLQLIQDAFKAVDLAKTDLTTLLVNEFPELQGIIGCYFARRDGESENVAVALREQYLPRFSGDALPQTPIGQALALADRIDTLVGTFGISHIPTGDKDPYGLRRAALGIIRILIEKEISLDLKEILKKSFDGYQESGIKLENSDTVSQLLTFINERLRAWYQEQGVTADVFASVAAIGVNNPLDMHERIKAVQAFKKLNQAEALSIANKRVSNILAKYTDELDAKAIDKKLFENEAEQELALQLEKKSHALKHLYHAGNYAEVLMQLAELHQPIDDFFNQVMVMTDDKSRRENRILLLSQLRKLFLQVADIALLQ